MPDEDNPGPAAEAADSFELGEREQLQTGLDPHLQELILAVRAAREIDSSLGHRGADGEFWVDVIAKLVDPAAEVPGLRVVRRIGPIVTGSVAVSHIEAVRDHANVVSLKRSTRLHSELAASLPELGATRAALAGLGGASVPDGTGVVVGVVDYGCDFAHANFRRADGSSRIAWLWDQRGPGGDLSPAGFGYGREHSGAALERALAARDPYAALEYDPGEGAHGTHVLDIAAGNGRATGQSGVAPGADIIFVHVASEDYAEEESFGNSRRLLEAVDYVFTRAAELGKSAVVNISLGTHGGPHDGSTLAEQGFDELLREPGRAIVISAGNAYTRASHASATIAPSGTRTLGWDISSLDESDNELEVWYDGRARLELALVPPNGRPLGPVGPGETVQLRRGGEVVGRLVHRAHDPNNGDNQINVVLAAGLSAGRWGIALSNPGTDAVLFHAWIERDDDGQSHFAAEDDDPSHSIGSIACGRSTLVVGSYDARDPARELSSFSSAGPTRDGKQKPELSAPGQHVSAASSRGRGTLDMSGTSMASPHVAGLAALLLGAAGRSLPCDELRALVLASARRDPPGGADWHARYGRGRADASGSLARALGVTVPAAAPRAPAAPGRAAAPRQPEPVGAPARAASIAHATIGPRLGVAFVVLGAAGFGASRLVDAPIQAALTAASLGALAIGAVALCASAFGRVLGQG